MEPIVFFYPDGHEAHVEQGHPERPQRVEAVVEGLSSQGWWQQYRHLDPLDLPSPVLSSIHAAGYLQHLKQASRVGRSLNLDTYLTRYSWDLALRAAGGGIAVARYVWSRQAERGFALTRPPGHHATPNQAMGFCLLNNVALAAEDLIQNYEAARLAIVDIDLHHGNGTQDIFWPRGDVLYVSTHQSSLYPGTGHLEEVGEDEGQGSTVNIPLPPYAGDLAMEAALERVIIPLLERFKPEMLLVSAGFDPHWRDPLGHLLWSAAGYGRVVGHLTAWADQHCQGRIAMFLEGGYDLDALAACAQASAAALLGEPFEDPLGLSPWPEDDRWRPVIREAVALWGLG